ncbi:hypothetical protein GCM10010840_31480 [Deinococcus aerolatus]|uniref:Uncharacterized protein n=1 Tax=Deinococcus aerolatus TaxID=522487 RepID=A0ABQ2GE56_9DEIO|nr:hypothetical protein [Deinococcus aerolatus]GGL91084.1 hypothetical protein GCM10010840_31480 [Deinococcus aerolatus]
MGGLPVSELLREYQGYVLAYRLRAAVGGRVAPDGEQLSLPAYASTRIERQDLARGLIKQGLDAGRMRRLDRLSDTLMFGFWLNPAEVAAFLRAAIREGSHPALGRPDAFAALLTHSERARLGEAGVQQVCAHHLACLTLAVPMLDPDGLSRAWQRIEDTTPPLFLDELAAVGVV